MGFPELRVQDRAVHFRYRLSSVDELAFVHQNFFNSAGDLGGDVNLDVEPPALIKGYLKCGATVLGPPSWDPDFGTADLPMMLKLAALPPSYRRRFLRA